MLLAFDPAGVYILPCLALTALSTVFWSISSLLQRKLAGVPVPVLYAWIGFMGAAVLEPVVLIFEPGAMTGLFAIGPEDFGAISFSDICSTLIGQGGMAGLRQLQPIRQHTNIAPPPPHAGLVASRPPFHTHF